MNLKYSPFYLFFLFMLGFAACKSDATQHESGEKNYSIYILGKNGKEYILETGSLDTGVLYPEKSGVALDPKSITRMAIVKDGYYYHMNRKNGTFCKYRTDHNTLKKEASLPVSDFSIENYDWIGKDTLLLTGLNAADFSQVKYVIIKTQTMQQIAAGNMDIPKPSGRFDNMSVGFVELRSSKLFVGYTYHEQLSTSDYTTSDTTYVSVFNFPQMSLVKEEKNVRSTYPGGVNTIQSYSFHDEIGDYYFMVCPGIALGNRPELPTGIMRMKAGTDYIDKNYFTNISSSIIQNHAYGMWYLSNGQAIVRSERKDLFKGLDDHYSTAHFEFYLVDITQEKIIKKLDLPLDRGTRKECVIVNGDVAYIAVNSTTEGNYIWRYNIKTGVLKKGLQLAGNTDYILRLDKLQK